MFGLSPLVAALAVTVVALVASTWWFGVHRRRKAETSAGIQALAGMKWRECAGLVLQALGEKGYREAPSSRQPGDGGTEFLLIKGNERCLMGYKHGTAYRLGEANVRDFANAVQLQGADSGMLVTLGTAESFARDLARRYDVELMDGRSLWPQVEPFAPPQMVLDIRAHAAREIRRGQRLGMAGSVALGLLVFIGGYLAQPRAPEIPAPAIATPAPAAAPPAAAPPAPGPDAAPAAAEAAPATAAAPQVPEVAPSTFEDAASREADEALRELEAVAKLTDEERQQRRLAAAAQIAELEAADSALWSTQSTLVIRMVAADGIDSGLVNEACAVLINFEELRYSRLQLEPPAGSAAPVRWRQCQ